MRAVPIETVLRLADEIRAVPIVTVLRLVDE
jgi:hypothetical protein